MTNPTEQEYLNNLGLWARDKVLPLLRKIPPATKILLPNPDGKKPIESTAEIEIGKVFESCPQKFASVIEGKTLCSHAVPTDGDCYWCKQK